MSSLSNKDEERKDLKDFIQLLNKEIILSEKNFGDSPDLKFTFENELIGIEHTRASAFPTTKGDLFKIFDSRKKRILDQLEKLLDSKKVVFGELTFIFNERLLNSKERDQVLANELFSVLMENLKLKNEVPNNETIDLLLTSNIRPYYLDQLQFRRNRIEENWISEMMFSFSQLNEKEEILKALKSKEKKIKKYRMTNIDELWLLIVMPDDIVGAPMNKSINEPIHIQGKDQWDKIFLYYRFSHSFKEVNYTNQIDSIE
jgi:hypothetical protein